MLVNSANIALVLLTGQANVTNSTTPVEKRLDLPKPPADAAPASTPPEKQAEHKSPFDEVFMAWAKRFQEISAGFRNGNLSPFATEIATSSGIEKLCDQTHSDPRLQFEGHYAAEIISTMGETAPKRDADFPSRRDAMAYAYHFAADLAQKANSVAKDKPFIEVNKDGTGRIYGISPSGRMYGNAQAVKDAYEMATCSTLLNMQNMETSAAALAHLFSFDATSVTVDAYDGVFKGFSITHGALGKIMDIAADKSVTLYDAEGKAYSAEEYHASNIDGGIPQLSNDLIRYQR